MQPATYPRPGSRSEPFVLRIYNLYRLILSCGLFLLCLTGLADQLLRAADNPWLLPFSFLYLLFNLMTLGLPTTQDDTAYFTVASVDILFLALLFWLSYGAQINLGNLVIVAIAAGNILISGRLGLLLAALASLLVLGISLTASLQTGVDRHINAGMLGILYFVTAIVVQHLAAQLRRTEELALQRRRENLYLQQLNTRIVQRMRTGIMVLKGNARVVMMNQAAGHLLGVEPQVAPLVELAPALADQFYRWQRNPQLKSLPQRYGEEGPQVKASFSHLAHLQEAHTLVFLDDTSVLAQQAQQLKLASLGQLTASIAHEIRNPLGAISHAGQLLQESETLTAADRKLAEIIVRHSDRVNRVIENILGLSRRRASLPERLNLVLWLKELLAGEEVRGLIRTPVALEVIGFQPSIQFDPSQLQQVLINLISNGVRCAQQAAIEPEIRLRCGSLETTQQPFLEVIDNGPGVAAELREQIFEPFFTTDKQGTGLGLYLCRELCEANQASLKNISYNGGACFQIIFAHPQKRVEPLTE